MENASKALVMAGGVLIAIMIIATLMYMFNQSATYSSELELQEKKEQIAKYNKEYESYQKSLIRGTEILSIMNKAINNNTNNINNSDGMILVKVTLLDDIVSNTEIIVKKR